MLNSSEGCLLHGGAVGRPSQTPNSCASDDVVQASLRVLMAWALLVQDGFVVETTSGSRFEDVDLSEGEWAEYDEKLGDSVSIMDLQWQFEVKR